MGKTLLLVFYSFIIFLLLLGTNSVAQTFLINNKTYTPINGYFSENQLREIGFNIIKGEKIYLIYNKKLVVGSNGDFLIDFEQYLPNSYTISNGIILVSKEFIAEFFKLNKIGEVFFDKPITINSVNLEDDKLTISTSAFITKDFVNFKFSNGMLTIHIFPADLSRTINAKDMTVNKSNGAVVITLSKQIENYNFTFSGNTIQINLIPFIRKVEYIKKTESYAGRTFLVNYLIVDPRFVNILPVLPKNGIGKIAPLYKILSENGLQHGVNANYFDPATGLPIDLIIAEGKPISHRYGLRPVFVQTSDNKVFIGKNYIDITVRIGDVLLLVKGVNTRSPSEVNLYTEEFGLTIPKDTSRSYIVVKSGKVSSIGYTQYVQSNSMVLMVSNEILRKYLPGELIGKNVSIEIYTDDGYKIKNAVGAGPLLLQGGKIIPDANEEKLRYGGNIPTTRTDRTIVAIKDGKVHLITIQGLNGTGMNFDESANFLLSKGYESAMMLDGGSSTTMIYAGKYVTNGSPRNIPVALGLKIY